MNPDKTAQRWDRVKELFAGAVGRSAAERARFLQEACGGEPGVLTEVESLLAAHDAAGDLFDPPPQGGNTRR